MEELFHHGILGQKWGKKNGPPYPLDEEDYSFREIYSNEISAGKDFVNSYSGMPISKLLSNVHFKMPNMDPMEYEKAVDLYNNVKELSLDYKTKNDVISALNTKLSSKDTLKSIETVDYGNNIYYAITKELNDYKIYDIRKIPDTRYDLDDILTEVVGKDWRLYNE